MLVLSARVEVKEGKMTKMIEGLKAIAEALSHKTKFTYTDRAVQQLIRRENDPLPVEIFDGRIGIREDTLDMWVARRKGVARTRKSA